MLALEGLQLPRRHQLHPSQVLAITNTSVNRIEQVVEILIKDRDEARKAKDFGQADAIRKRLDDIGIVLEDGPQGTTWRFK